MAITEIRYDREEIERALRTVEARFPHEIEYIRYEVRPDWSADPAIYVRVLLKDSADTANIPDRDASRRVHELAERVRRPFGERSNPTICSNT